jgi:acyl carrier protein
MPDATEFERRVIDIVADALDVDRSAVRPHASLIDDLGAESIDFLDIVFRLETAFGIKIRESDIWKGSVDPESQESIDDGVRRLKAGMPDFRWDALPERITRDDLPRLITVQTIVDYLENRDEDAPDPSGV